MSISSRLSDRRQHAHPLNVLVCHDCGALNEVEDVKQPGKCRSCRTALTLEGPAKRNHCACRHCGHVNRYPDGKAPFGTGFSRLSTTIRARRSGMRAASSRCPMLRPCNPRRGGSSLASRHAALRPKMKILPATRPIGCIGGVISVTAIFSTHANCSPGAELPAHRWHER